MRQSTVLRSRDRLEYCIVFVANDRVLDQVVAFLESIKQNSPNISLICIPYSDDIEKLAELADVYEFKFFIDFDISAVQNIAKIIYGRTVPRLRKLGAFFVPCREFLFLDVDIIVRKDLRPFFGHIDSSCDIVFTDISPEGTYINNKHPLIAHSIEINTGAYVSAPHVMDYPLFIEAIMRHFDVFREIAFFPNDDQAFMSFSFDIQRKKFRCIDNFNAPFSPRLWYGHPFTHGPDEVIDPAYNLPVSMVHFAGTSNYPLGHYGVWSDLFNHFMVLGRDRVANAGLNIL